MDQYPDTLPLDSDQRQIIHLAKAKSVIVLAPAGSEATWDDLTNSHFDSNIHTCIKLHYDKDI